MKGHCTFEGLFKGVQRHFGQPFDCDVEDTIFALSGQRNFQFDTIIADWQRIASVKITASIKHGFQRSKYFTVSMHHRLDNLSEQK